MKESRNWFLFYLIKVSTILYAKNEVPFTDGAFYLSELAWLKPVHIIYSSPGLKAGVKVWLIEVLNYNSTSVKLQLSSYGIESITEVTDKILLKGHYNRSQ